MAGEHLPDSIWRTMADRASDGLFVTDRDLRIRWANAAGVALFGYPAEQLAGRNFLELYDDKDEQLAREPLRYDHVQAGTAVTIVRAIRTAQGERRVIEIVATPLGDGLALGIARDVTTRVTAEERLARSEASFRALIENTPDGVVVRHRDEIVYINGAALDLLGYDDPSELLGTSVIALIHPGDRGLVHDRVRRLDDGTPTLPFTEERLVRKDGGVVTASVCAVGVDFGGRPCVAAIARDITEQRRLQARLLEADRLVALGTLSAGIAHEVNNPLTYLMLHQEATLAAAARLRDLLDAAPDEARAIALRIEQNIATAQDGAQRVRHIVRDLRIFARASDDARAPVDVRVSIRRALVIAGHELRDRVAVETELGDVPAVLASDGRLTQVFLNLIVNAAHALAGVEVGARRLAIRAWADADRVKVAVADNGAGIAPEHLPRLFEPFFTTKDVGEGCGLGLSVVHGIVTALGGAIDVDSRPGAGTTFTVSLPAVAA